jgi:hypothetical protein
MIQARISKCIFAALYIARAIGLVLVVLLLASLSVHTTMAQQPQQNTITFTPPIIPASSPDFANPMRGEYEWYGQQLIPAPWPVLDSYDRIDWADFETSQDVYNWTWMESKLAAAQVRGGKWGFRIMAADSSREGNSPAVPQYLVNEMPKGFWFTYPGQTYQTYAPDWNDPNYLSRTQALITAIAQKYGNDPRLGWVEIGNYGDWSEWHVWQYPYTGTPYGPSPTGATDMTAANKEQIITWYVNAFPHTRVLMPMDEKGETAWAIQHYPQLGLRRDCLGRSDFINQYMRPYFSQIENQWQKAPWVTEFCGLPPGSGDVDRAASQINQYHVSMIGGNTSSWGSYDASEQATIANFMKTAGYRFILDSLALPASIPMATAFSVTTQWSNVGVTPAYTPWNIMVQLRDGSGNIKWQGKSNLDLQTLLPTTSNGTETPIVVTDTFTLPVIVQNGTYTLALQVVDPWTYYHPLALANEGIQNDGSYTLGIITVGGSA